MSYPKTIDNGQGESLTFLGITVKDNIEYLEVENCIGIGAGPPMHVHYEQDERLTVIEGRMGMQLLGKEPEYLNVGESVHFHRGIMHKFWNAGEVTLKCKGEVWPPHNIEYFLTEVYRSVKSGRGRPSTFETAYLMNRYHNEFDMHGIPGFVRRLVFPTAILFGKLRGRHRKYRNAPPPLIV